jgi:predicted PurR-regulated permease PerM
MDGMNVRSRSKPLQCRPSSDEGAVMLHVPMNTRSAALGLIAVICSIAVLQWGRNVFIPFMLALVFSYALSPMVDRLVQWRLPRSLAAGLVVSGVIGGAGGVAWSLNDDAMAVVDSLPAATEKMRHAVAAWRPQGQSTLAKVQKAATQLERAATEGVQPPNANVPKVQVERPFSISDYLWTGTVNLMNMVGQIVSICLITFFLLSSGKSFRRKLVRIAGPTWREKRRTVRVLDTITDQVKAYLRVQVATSVFCGATVGMAFAMLGVNHAAVWAVVALALNFIPYIGALVFTGTAVLISMGQFGTISMALTIGILSMAIFTIEGSLLTPWLSSRASRMSPVVIFMGLLAGGWMWGVWGLFLAVPMLMIIKAVCDHVENLNAIGELMAVEDGGRS